MARKAGKGLFEDSDYGIEIRIEDGLPNAKDVDAEALVVSDGGTLRCISDLCSAGSAKQRKKAGFQLGENDCKYSAQLTIYGSQVDKGLRRRVSMEGWTSLANGKTKCLSFEKGRLRNRFLA